MKKKAGALELHLRICSRRQPLLGPGKYQLLGHVDRTGSLSEAAKAMEMSYMRAWTLVKAMNREWREPLVTLRRGGDQRGGAQLTETGREILRLYGEIAATLESSGQTLLKELARLR